MLITRVKEDDSRCTEKVTSTGPMNIDQPVDVQCKCKYNALSAAIMRSAVPTLYPNATVQDTFVRFSKETIALLIPEEER